MVLLLRTYRTQIHPLACEKNRRRRAPFKVGKAGSTSGQASKAVFHGVNLSEVAPHAMCAAKLPRRGSKAVGGEALASLQSAQVNHGCQILLLRQVGLRFATSGQSFDHAPVQIRGGHLDRMARQCSSIGGIEPAGMRIVPRTFGENRMIADAILSRHSESSIGDLKHAERARGRTIDFKGFHDHCQRQ